MVLNARTLLALLLLPSLGSCSYGYELLAVAIDGRIAFVVDPASRYQPDCLSSIYVSADDGEPKARAEPGDDERLIRNGSVYWWNFRGVRSCANEFPIAYGARLNGPPAEDIGYVAAKPLKRGVVYSVGAQGDGAYGSGWFKILPNGKIENYPSDPTPPVIDKDGNVVREADDEAS